jgi:hypothetical protein
MGAAGNSPALTITIAAMAAFAGLIGTVMGGILQARGAASVAKREAAAARAERFAAWQMRKRETYAELLRELQAHLASPEQGAEPAVRASLAKAVLVAHEELREYLLELGSSADGLSPDVDLRDLVGRLVRDIHQAGTNT